MSKDNIIRLGGIAFLVVTEETLTLGQDGYLLKAFEKAGLVDATLRVDETARQFADRISLELLASENGPQILSGGLVPCDGEGEPESWTREGAERRRVEIFERLAGADRKLAIGLLGSIAAHFFEQGIGRLHLTRASSSGSDAAPEGSSIFDPPQTKSASAKAAKTRASDSGQTS